MKVSLCREAVLAKGWINLKTNFNYTSANSVSKHAISLAVRREMSLVACKTDPCSLDQASTYCKEYQRQGNCHNIKVKSSFILWWYMLICPLLTGSDWWSSCNSDLKTKTPRPITVLYKVQEQRINRVQGNLPDLRGILSSTILSGNLLFKVQQVSPSGAGCTLTHWNCDLAFQPCAPVVAELTPAARDQMEITH